MKMLNKIFNFYTLVIINVAIIWAAELSGQGHLFFETGAIHGIAILFIILALTRLVEHYYIADPILKRFLQGSLAALLLFSASHVIEFLSYFVAGSYTDALFASVANFYLLSLLMIIIGAEYFLQYYYHRSPQIVRLLMVTAAAFFALTVWFVFQPASVSLDLQSSTPYLYTLMLCIIGGYAVVDTIQIGKAIPFFKDFSGVLTMAVGLIIFAAVTNIFYDLHGALGVDEYQFVYLSHFTFYAALSAIYLSFGKLTGTTGLHRDIREFAEGGAAGP
ncbi:MAG: hypothetical protein KGI60_03920 [Patescibacteria group bacterium]|nr:hypothetical protein [Patescibacteria group bacterium]